MRIRVKEEGEIFEEWYNLNFEEPPDPLEYIYLRDSLDFQRYLLRYRGKELVESIKRELLKLVEKADRFRKGRNNDRVI